jgi:hypothetical protein
MALVRQSEKVMRWTVERDGVTLKLTIYGHPISEDEFEFIRAVGPDGLNFELTDDELGEAETALNSW